MKRCALAFVLAMAPWADAAPLGRAAWIEAGQVPLPASARSVEILRSEEPLYSRPDKRSPRRGAAAKGARLPIYGAQPGPGCPDRWLMVGPVAWVCESVIKLSGEAPLEPLPAASIADGLPHRYYFVGRDGSLGYSNLSLAEEGIPDAELQPGFAVAISEIRSKHRGDAFGLTTHALWLPMRDLGAVQPFLFRGEQLAGALDVAWVVSETASVWESPDGRKLPHETRTRLEAFRTLESRERHRRRWFRIGERRWLSGREARAPTTAEPPPEVLPGERWIDVDIERQVLTAYEGDRPVFATLVSTGKGTGSSVQATPKGSHRLWVKLVSSDMDNLEDEEASRYYAMQSVPWVMYFKKGYGLHGTFWHRSFGNVRSHGCVNLTPLDAQHLFHWTSPRLPAGWSAALPTDYERGTLVRVR